MEEDEKCFWAFQLSFGHWHNDAVAGMVKNILSHKKGKERERFFSFFFLKLPVSYMYI
jgi:hypothetical protein